MVLSSRLEFFTDKRYPRKSQNKTTRDDHFCKKGYSVLVLPNYRLYLVQLVMKAQQNNN